MTAELGSLGIAALLVMAVVLGVAVLVLGLRNPVAALVASVAMGLALALLFAVLRAPRLAMAQAAIGGGLSALILALGLARLGLLGAGARTESETAAPADQRDAPLSDPAPARPARWALRRLD